MDWLHWVAHSGSDLFLVDFPDDRDELTHKIVCHLWPHLHLYYAEMQFPQCQTSLDFHQDSTIHPVLYVNHRSSPLGQ